MLALHFTSEQHDVVVDGSLKDTVLDIQTIGDASVSYDAKLKPAKRVKLSVSFDGSRVDELQAARFL